MGGMGCQVCHESPCTCTFMDSAVAGNYDDMQEAFDDAVGCWHVKRGTDELHEFLGMTMGEFRRVVEKPGALEQVVTERRAKPPIAKVEPRVLAPCARRGGPGEWWTEQHVSCTGSQHVYDPVLGVVEIGCSCTECHGNKKLEEPKGAL